MIKDNSKKMETMRDEGKTLEEIAQVFETSRQYIHKILGKTSSAARTSFNKIKSRLKDLTYQDAVTYGRGTSILQKELGKIRHKSTRQGTSSEIIVSKKLSSIGIDNELMPLNHPFDILLRNGKRVDVKSTEKTRTTSSRQRNDMYAFKTNKGKRGNYCDYFICHIKPHNIYFVIPCNVVNEAEYIYISYPKPSRSWSKFHKYENRFDLLQEPKP